jgi:hypothetical protein
MGLVKKPTKGEHSAADHAMPPPAPRKRKDEAWTREDFYRDLTRATGPIEQAIRRDPKEVERLKRRLRRAQEGEGPWGVEDKDENENDATG